MAIRLQGHIRPRSSTAPRPRATDQPRRPSTLLAARKFGTSQSWPRPAYRTTRTPIPPSGVRGGGRGILDSQAVRRARDSSRERRGSWEVQLGCTCRWRGGRCGLHSYRVLTIVCDFPFRTSHLKASAKGPRPEGFTLDWRDFFSSYTSFQDFASLLSLSSVTLTLCGVCATCLQGCRSPLVAKTEVLARRDFPYRTYTAQATACGLRKAVFLCHCATRAVYRGRDRNRTTCICPFVHVRARARMHIDIHAELHGAPSHLDDLDPIDSPWGSRLQLWAARVRVGERVHACLHPSPGICHHP